MYDKDINRFFISSFSSIIGTILVHPLDYCRVALQINYRHEFINTYECSLYTMKRYGIWGLYTGLNASII